MSRMIYGLLRTGCPDIAVAGVGGAPIEQVQEGPLTALVSEAPEELLARRRDVTAHMDVLDEAMRHGAVLPFRFGTVVDDNEAVRAMLRERSGELLQQLDDLDGAVQVTLRITHDEDAVVRLVLETDARLQRAVRASSRRAELSSRIAIGELVASTVAAQAEADRSYVLDALAPVTLAIAAGDDQAAVVSAALLVMRDRLPEVDAVVTRVKEHLGERAHFDYAGPMPAYSFVR